MRRIILLLSAVTMYHICLSQNVGIGTINPTEKLHVVGNRALFETNYFSIGAGEPATGFTTFQINKNINNYVGMYVNSGASGLPFYGYALNGVAKSYTMFNGGSNQFEYHQTSDATPDFFINGNAKAVFNTGFVGIGTSTPTTGFTGFAMKNNVNTFYGSYIDAGLTGTPFYGYALNGTAVAYTGFNGANNRFEYHHTSDAISDFQIGNTDAAFPNTNFLGIGTTSPTTGFTGLALKKNTNSFWGMYVDAGTTGLPFYGYALNGTAVAYTGFSGTNNRFEYHHTSDAIADFQISNTEAAFPNTNFLGIGTTTPTTGFTGLALKNNTNNFWGMYVDAGTTGVPFYGYALNGTAKSYTSFNGPNSQFEYHQTSDAIPDFLINGNTKAVFNTGFVGIGTGTPTTGFTGFAMKTAANAFYGMYVDAGTTGVPFYGYALNGTAKSYTSFNSANSQFEYHQTSDAIPEFLINGNTKAVFNTGFVGIGTGTPTTGFTGFAMKTAANAFYGMYVDAGTTGVPFYGYALNGTAQAYTTYNGNTSQFEYHHTADATPDFSISNTQASFPIQTALTVGTSTPFNSVTGLTLKNLAATGFYGMYIESASGGSPFYGYATNGSIKAYTQISGNNWELVTGTTAITVTSTGSVGIGDPTPSQKLDVNGTIRAANLTGGATTLSTDASGNIIRTPSDANLKDNIEEINDALNKVDKMHGVTYNFKDTKRFGSNRQMGFLAQDLEQVVPEAVSSGGEYKSVNYQVLTALLAEAIKQQQRQIQQQKKENDDLKNKLEMLTNRIEKIEAGVK